MSDTPPEPPAEQPLSGQQDAQPPAGPVIEPPRPHPIRLVNNDELKRSRLTVLVRLLLGIPHMIWAYVLYPLPVIAVVIANWFTTLVRGRPSQRMQRYLMRYLRYSVYVTAYLNLLANPYPPFHGSEGYYPIDVHIWEPEGGERQGRLGVAFRILLAIPALVLTYVFNQVMQIVALLGWFVAIAIGRLPRGMENLGLYCLRYQAETGGYLMILTARYPSLTAPRP
jgi:Domain of unknown function (DUF4389)